MDTSIPNQIDYALAHRKQNQHTLFKRLSNMGIIMVLMLMHFTQVNCYDITIPTECNPVLAGIPVYVIDLKNYGPW